MDQLIVELIGKPKLNVKGKLITLVAQNFAFLEDQAKFLKATFAIPTEKQLPLDGVQKVLIQIGSLHQELKNQLDRANWNIIKHDKQMLDSSGEHFCDILRCDISKLGQRSLLIINDASRIHLLLEDKKKLREFLQLLDEWKRQDNHFVLVLYQQTQADAFDSFQRHLEHISDACIQTKSYKDCYLQYIWYQPIPTIKALLPPKLETSYYTCKIGKSYWSSDLLCFYERVRVDKGFNPDLATNNTQSTVQKTNPEQPISGESGLERALEKVGLNYEDDEQDLNSSTLPYTHAQNPEKSRIFYYPDKNDDVDEDDPDDDLGI